MSEEQALKDHREKWLKIGLATGPCDREKVEAAVDEVYKKAELPTPKIKLWFDSPLAGALACTLLLKFGERRDKKAREITRSWKAVKAGDLTEEEAWCQVGELLRDRKREEMSDRSCDQIWDHVWDQVWKYTGIRAYDQTWERVKTIDVQVENGLSIEQITGPIRDQVWGQVKTYMRQSPVGLAFFSKSCSNPEDRMCECGHGLHDAPRFSLMAECGWWWPFDDLVILTDRPVSCHLDEENRLHNENAPALSYADGFSVYCCHGVRVSKDIIEAPETITPDSILAESDLEVVKVMLPRYVKVHVAEDK